MNNPVLEALVERPNPAERAAVVSASHQLVVSDRQQATPPPGHVRLEVRACGVCGSDLHLWHGDPGYEWVELPRVPGHEIAGIVDAIGEGVEGWSVGDRAAVVSIQGCLACTQCRSGRTQRCADRRVIGLDYDGGLAESVIVPAEHLVGLPAGLTWSSAALVEPVSVAVHAVARAEVSGRRVHVSGPGFIGLACAAVARARGAEVTISGAAQDERVRLPLARELGIRVTAPSEMSVEPGGRPEVWLEASGAPEALRDALVSMRPGGAIVIVGLPSRPVTALLTSLVRDEVAVMGSYASTLADYHAAADLLKGALASLADAVTTGNLDALADVFTAAASGEVVKPVVTIGAESDTAAPSPTPPGTTAVAEAEQR